MGVARAVGATTGSLGHYSDDKDAVLDVALFQLVGLGVMNIKGVWHDHSGD